MTIVVIQNQISLVLQLGSAMCVYNISFIVIYIAIFICTLAGLNPYDIAGGKTLVPGIVAQ